MSAALQLVRDRARVAGALVALLCAQQGGAAAPTAPATGRPRPLRSRVELAPASADVRMFGARCDGKHVADDTAAFLAAAEEIARTGAALEVPPGDCTVNRTVILPPSAHVRGQSRRGSRITFTGRGPLFLLSDSMEWWAGHTGAVVESLTLLGPGRESETQAIATATDPGAGARYDGEAKGAAHAIVRDLDVDGFGAGISGMFQSATFERNYITRCGTGIRTSRNSLNVAILRTTIYQVDYGIVSRGDTARILWNNIENLDAASQPHRAVKAGAAIVIDGGLDTWVEENHVESSVVGIDVLAGQLVSRNNYFGGVATGIRIHSKANYASHRLDGDHFHGGKASVAAEPGAQRVVATNLQLTGGAPPAALSPSSTIDGLGRRRVVGAAGEPAFENGWTNLGGGLAPVGFGLEGGAKMVRLAGVLSPGVNGSPAFTLPPDHRPSSRVVLAAIDLSGVPARVDVEPDGAVVVRSMSTRGVSLDGLTFRID